MNEAVAAGTDSSLNLHVIVLARVPRPGSAPEAAGALNAPAAAPGVSRAVEIAGQRSPWYWGQCR